MKVLGTAVTLLGAVTLMLAIIVAQRDYQRSWGAGAVAQTSTLAETKAERANESARRAEVKDSAALPAVPERIAQANS